MRWLWVMLCWEIPWRSLPVISQNCRPEMSEWPTEPKPSYLWTVVAPTKSHSCPADEGTSILSAALVKKVLFCISQNIILQHFFLSKMMSPLGVFPVFNNWKSSGATAGLMLSQSKTGYCFFFKMNTQYYLCRINFRECIQCLIMSVFVLCLR